MKIKDEIRKQFEGLSREEVLKVLQSAGFNVTDGTGKIIITDDRGEQ